MRLKPNRVCRLFKYRRVARESDYVYSSFFFFFFFNSLNLFFYVDGIDYSTRKITFRLNFFKNYENSKNSYTFWLKFYIFPFYY